MSHLAIVGTTASGKSSIAMEIARRRQAVELVSVDSMQVYRGMDIGTAKPTPEEQAEVRHHLIDLIDPSEDYTVSQFQHDAETAVADIVSRAARPVLVGGTGLHLRAVIDRLTMPAQFPAIRAALDNRIDTEQMYGELMALDPISAGRMEPTNHRRIARALEVCLGSGQPFSSFGPGLDTYPPTQYRLLGVRLPRPVIDRRIEDRYRLQMDSGFLGEVERLATKPLSRTASQALGYRELLAHLRGDCSLDDALETAIVRTRQFARRQERWFRRDPRIQWIDVDKPEDAIEHALSMFDGNPMVERG